MYVIKYIVGNEGVEECTVRSGKAGGELLLVHVFVDEMTCVTACCCQMR